MEMRKQFEVAQKMVQDLESKGAKIAVACVGASDIMIKALFVGIWFEYSYAGEKLSVTCNGEVVEEMIYKF